MDSRSVTDPGLRRVRGSNPNTTVDWTKYSPITGDPAFYYRKQPPYTESYTLSIDVNCELVTILNVGYVGTQAHHLLVLTPHHQAMRHDV